ncbi:MAG: hypothetical protein COA41_15400 [Sphingopyxis sp.]|nr:MAG: hypothetical protein COA41_15400 [Sphingopyxis sp.]
MLEACFGVRGWDRFRLRDVRDFASKQNQSAEGFLASEKLGSDTAAASKAAAEAGMREMAKVYQDKGQWLYLVEDEVG